MEDGPALGSVRAEKLQPTRWTFYPVGYSVFFKLKPELCVPIHWDFPGGSVSKESAYNAGNAGDMSLILGWEDPLDKGMATHSSILAWRLPMDSRVCRL